MTDRHVNDSGPTDCDAVAFEAQSRNSVNASAAVPPEFDSSTPLLSESRVQNNGDLESQETSTTLVGDDSPPMTWRERGYVVVTVIAFLALFVVSNALEAIGSDPLYFTTLTWHSTVAALVIAMLLIPVSEKVMQSKNDKTIPSGVHLRYALFVIAVVYWGTWLCFYGTIWMWAVIHYPGSHPPVWQMNRVWTAFQATIDAPDALTKLTTCLQEALPEGNATIADFTACLRSMGIADGR